MSSSKRNSTIVGYSYILFQSGGHALVKCWFDGSESYDFIYIEDFINLFEKVGSTYEQILGVQRCLDTTSFYLWDVDQNIVIPARLDNTPDRNIGDDLNQTYADALRALTQDPDEIYRIV